MVSTISKSDFAAKSNRYSAGLRSFMSEWMILVLFIALFALCSLTIDQFLEIGNLMNIARQISFLTIVALGQFFVILIAHMDLSIGSSIGLTSVLLAGLIAFSGLPAWLAILAVFGAAVLIGIVNGLLVIYGRVPAFIATLVMMNVLMGLAYIYSRGSQLVVCQSGSTIWGWATYLASLCRCI